MASADVRETDVWICEEDEADILRLYFAIFNREHDLPGGEYWRDQHRNGVSMDDISFWMAKSPEYNRKYVNVISNADFIDRVYRNIFRRVPDQKGKQYWIAEMANGLDKHLVIRWMAKSPELKKRHDYRLNSTCPSTKTVQTSQPVNRVSTRSYYSNCSEVERVLGRSLLIGEMGYSTHLDRDRDGVACENAGIAYETVETQVLVPSVYIPSPDYYYATAAQWKELRECESGDNYSISSSNGLYHGAYQITQQTWDSVARSIGKSNFVGLKPNKVIPAGQDLIAKTLFEQRGSSPWPHCNKYLK